MSYTDLRDFAPEYSVDLMDYSQENVYAVELEKLGGGTFGTPYRGNWRAIIKRNGEEIFRSQDFVTGTPMTHRQAAIELMEYLTDDVTAFEFKFAMREQFLSEDGEWTNRAVTL